MFMKALTATEVLTFEAFGVSIGIICSDSVLIQKIREVLPIVVPKNLIFGIFPNPEHIFTLRKFSDPIKFSISKNEGEEIYLLG